MQWILDNKQWVFSGIGVFILTGIVALVRKNKSGINQNQKSGNNSTNYQAGGDIKIGKK